MKISICALAVFATALSGSTAFAQSAPLRGVGLLALDAGESHGGHHALVALPDDDGGGTIGPRALRGSDGPIRERRTSSDAETMVPKAPAFDAPSPPAAETPKRPTYRWQSLVPGAIK